MMHRAMVNSLVLCVCLPLFFGCTNDAAKSGASEQSPDGHGSLNSSPVSVYPGGGGVGEGALLKGELVLRGDCLLVTEEGTGEQFIPVFPESAVEWDGRTETVTYGGRALSVGAVVTLGGGADASAIDRSKKCPSLRQFVVSGLPD